MSFSSARQQSAPADLPSRPPRVMQGSRVMRCVDDSAWNNLHGKACIDYSAYCEAGAFRLGASWAGGEVFNWPERNCCACGKPAAEQAPEKGQLFETHTKSFCRGTDHEVKLKDGAACVDHCHPSKRPCACFHFAHGECHFTFNYAGLATSTKSSTAWVSSTALLASSKTAAASSGASCAPVPVLRSPPSFYMYNDAPFAWGPRLAACFVSRQGVPPWAMAVNDSTHQLDGTAQPGLAYSLWLSAALAGHRRRVATPEQARARRVRTPCAGPQPCALRPALCSQEPDAANDLTPAAPRPCSPPPPPPPSLLARRTSSSCPPSDLSPRRWPAARVPPTCSGKQRRRRRCAHRRGSSSGRSGARLASRPLSSASPWRWLSPRRLLPLPSYPSISLPTRHVILASSHSADDHDPLGALGSLAAKAGAVSQPHRPLHHRCALCIRHTRCARCARYCSATLLPPLGGAVRRP